MVRDGISSNFYEATELQVERMTVQTLACRTWLVSPSTLYLKLPLLASSSSCLHPAYILHPAQPLSIADHH